MNLSIREKVLITLLAVIAILFGGIQFLVMPAVQGANAQDVKLEDTRLQYINAQEIMNNIDSYDKGLEKAKINAASASAAFFPSLDSELLNVWAEGIVVKCGLKTNSIQITDPKLLPVTLPKQSPSPLDYPIGEKADQIIQKSTSSASPSSAAQNAKPGTTVVIMSQITVKVKGSFQNIQSFLNSVSGCGKTATVSAMEIGGYDVSGYSAVITVDCYAVKKIDDNDQTLNWNQGSPAGQDNVMK